MWRERKKSHKVSETKKGGEGGREVDMASRDRGCPQLSSSWVAQTARQRARERERWREREGEREIAREGTERQRDCARERLTFSDEGVRVIELAQSLSPSWNARNERHRERARERGRARDCV